METTLLMSTEDIKSITSISDNIDSEALKGFMINSQLRYISNATGTAFYDSLLNDVASGGTTYQYFLENYLYQALAFSTLLDFIPFHHAKIQKVGVVVAATDNSRGADDTELSRLMKSVESNQVYFLNRMVEFLDTHKDEALYSLYRGSCETDYRKKNSSSIFLPKR